MEKNKLLGVLPEQSIFYELSFQVKPFSAIMNSNYANVIDVTLGENLRVYGDRNPSVYFEPRSTKMVVYSAINNDKGYYWTFETPLPLNKYTSVKISQKLADGKLYFKVFINDIEEDSVENKYPQFFSNMKIYGSNPWSQPADADIKNYNFRNIETGMNLFFFYS